MITQKTYTNVKGDAIFMANQSNIVISQCHITGAKGVGIHLFNCNNITIKLCRIENVAAGIYAQNCTNIQVLYNEILNTNRKFVEGRGQAVQFNNTSGIIACNSIFNDASSDPEDAINVYQSSSVSVLNNFIQCPGAKSASGGGICLGDNGGSNQVASGNILVQPGQYGIQIAGGDNMRIIGNQVYSPQTRISNVGIFVWGQAGCIVTNATVDGNQVNWTDMHGNPNDFWDGKNAGIIKGVNQWQAPLNAGILPQ